MRDPFEIDGKTIKAGKQVTVELRVSRMPAGTWSTMPVVVIHGSSDGPTVWINAATHGDELNGVAIVRELITALDAKALGGTVLAVPVVNVFGTITGERSLPDGRDLNRSFPGSARGSMASRLASLFFNKVAAHCVAGIDYHTGAGGRSNLPQIRCDLEDDEARRLAEAFHPPLIYHSNPRDGSLRVAASKRGKHVLLYEGGEALRFSRNAISTGVSGTLRVFQALGMIEGAPAVGLSPSPRITRKSRWCRAPRTGFCYVHVRRGEEVEAGQRVATIMDSTGRQSSSVKAKVDGIVIGVLTTALVHRGDALVHIAE